MPINPDKFEDQTEEEKAAKSSQVAQGEGANITGAQAQSAALTPTSSKSSGSFTNLSQYVEANKDQAGGLGGKIQQNVEKEAQAGTSGLAEASKQYSQAQEAAGVNPEQFSEQKVKEVAQKALTSPSQVGQSDIDAFNEARTKSEALSTGKDTAPKSLSELNKYQEARGKLETAAQKAQSTATEAGREQLLQEAFKRPNYTKGQSTFDQLLTQNAPDNRAKFQSLRDNLLGQYGLAGQDAQAIQQAAEKRAQTVAGTQQAVQNIQQGLLGEQGALTKYQTDLLARPEQLAAQQQSNLDQNKKAVRDYLVSQYGAKPFGIDVNQLVDSVVTPSAGVTQANIQNVISRGENSDLAKLQVLNKLAGRDQNLLGETVLSETGDQFTSDVDINRDAAQRQIDEKRNIAASDIKSKAGQALNISIPDVYGKTLAGSNGVQYAIDRVNGLMKNPQYDAAENTKVYNALQKQLDNINNYRKQYNLPPVTVNQNKVVNNRQALINKVGTAIRGGYSPEYSISRQERLISSVPGWGDAYYAAAKVKTIYELLQDIQNNPLMGAPNVNLNQFALPANTRMF